jgi:hypothetical protein
MGDLVPSGDPDLTIFIILTLVGFVVGALGHLYKSTPVIVTGIVLIMVGTIILPLIVFRGGS